MKSVMVAVMIASVAGAAAHAQTPQQDYPSCNRTDQHAVAGQRGGSITDARQAHISVRANILQADIGTARKARRITERQSAQLWQRVDKIRRATDRFVAKQGFLSAAERASYDRELDAIALQICR
ncbi:hypothetical protein HMP09_2517 [Sphingomonas sp. HMP9]|uniref:hypothetical protein n=1 Tax=Sphingomonas sp. HMP9 TaxID=1517554 RepID=UPI00159A0285|nr:hypothetical protein [Sphingomonas sp. HMP9]BCA63283.1 hypothetical protein HMP09_2517 [Sphingomonas sp. HMP9]